ncbi:terpene synthase family protein [Chryseobacterium sp. Y16C]|uniref:terpene synthase family protein n=1 Tax=Chryseobacterium sp. Y16C TaxID=2920939 RepID=UPI001F0B1C96|nr:terpene synthase family protein [Chryseobacterium sp. Y16C]UMQ41809.1 terpene synthase family protein [Chryseobacterium sp. Y16C]
MQEVQKKPKQLILNGKINTEEVTIPLGTMLFSLRQELLQFIPEESISRFTQMINRYFIGLAKGVNNKKNKKFPTITKCIALREDSICLYPFLQLTEVETDVILPQEIHDHPVIRRLQALACRSPLKKPVWKINAFTMKIFGNLWNYNLLFLILASDRMPLSTGSII